MSAKFYFYSMVSILAFVMGCSSSKSDSPTAPAATQPEIKSKQVPPGSRTLDGGDIKLTYASQQPQLNTLSEVSPQGIGLFYKVFRLKSDRDLTISLDSTNMLLENCHGEDAPRFEIQITDDNKLISNLENNKTADIQADVDYRVRLYFTNFGACEKINFNFALLAFKPKTTDLATAPSPNLPDQVVCLIQDQNERQRGVVYNFRIGRVELPEIWLVHSGATGIQTLFGAFEACGRSSSLVKCKPNASFDGTVFSRSLSCETDGVEVSSGQTSFDLKTGLGNLVCKNSDGKSYNLVLSDCKVQP